MSLTRGNPAAAPDARETSGYWPFSILRKRKGGGAADGHANNKVSPVPAPEYDPRPAILTTPSVHQLRWAPSAAASPTRESGRDAWVYTLQGVPGDNVA